MFSEIDSIFLQVCLNIGCIGCSLKFMCHCLIEMQKFNIILHIISSTTHENMLNQNKIRQRILENSIVKGTSRENYCR